MTSTCIKTGLTLAFFVSTCVAAAQAPAEKPNSVPAAKIMVQQAAAPAVEANEPPLPALRVGMPAPALKVAKWFKGEPVERLEAGKLYVVEFWATWCGPCRATIPHMTELAHKYADKVTFIGVSVWERPKENTNEAIFALVEPFVAQMGDQMDYHVAADANDRTMAETWMTAADRHGIPCAFIVGRDGKIAWIGHPLAMDDVLEQVVAGTFDVQAEAKRQEIEWRKEQERKVLEAPIQAARRAGDNKALLEAIDKALAVQPEMEEDLMPLRLNTLMQLDEEAGFAYIKALLAKGDFEKNPYHAYNAAAIVNRLSGNLKNPDYALVLDALEKAKAGEQDNPSILALYAETLFRAGKIDQAIEVQQKVIEKAEPLVGTRLPQAWLDTQKTKLQEYKDKKN